MNLPLPPEFLLRVRRDEPMAKHTSWRVGGPAELFFSPRDRDDLASFLRNLPLDVPVYFVGLGSNLLVRDGGLRGAVVCTHGAFTRLERKAQKRVYCGAGVPCARLARQCGTWELGPAEFWGGIPGTFGGALAMNAGSFGGETWRMVQSVEVIDRRGVTHARARDEYQVGYRHVQAPVPGEWFLGAELELDRRDPATASTVRELNEKRRRTQPLDKWSCGSVFTNPPGGHAAQLIEAAGLKGCRIGGAVVSELHANFILNEGSATAHDLEQLILHVQATVAKVHGVTLVPEVRVVGEAA
jgi:UDP-N-acetylmuramate dehydrogenase